MAPNRKVWWSPKWFGSKRMRRDRQLGSTSAGFYPSKLLAKTKRRKGTDLA